MTDYFLMQKWNAILEEFVCYNFPSTVKLPSLKISIFTFINNLVFYLDLKLTITISKRKQ